MASLSRLSEINLHDRLIRTSNIRSSVPLASFKKTHDMCPVCLRLIVEISQLRHHSYQAVAVSLILALTFVPSISSHSHSALFLRVSVMQNIKSSCEDRPCNEQIAMVPE